ncbi:RNA polymerase sigma factor [Actinoplanes sp. NPDC051859]|uniref:RNA polymerase sigma factor n=1 Tax=Actinoplanes sp. NPDC051859 TaxID=3363909 RepID=UPI0037A248FC
MEQDEMLMSAVAGGDQDALRVLYERHAAVMLRLIRRLTQNRGVAEECLQESWLAVWQSAATFRGDAPVRSWLLGVARRQAHNRLRKASLTTVELNDTTDAVDTAPGVEEQVLAQARSEQLAKAVRGLPEHLREVLVLVLVEELPYQEVGAALDIPVGTVKSRMSHARKRLAAALTTVSERVGER